MKGKINQTNNVFICKQMFGLCKYSMYVINSIFVQYAQKKQV